MPMHSTGRWHPGKSRAAVRYAAMAWSDSSCAAKACPNPIHAGTNAPSSEVALLKYRRAASNRRTQ